MPPYQKKKKKKERSVNQPGDLYDGGEERAYLRLEMPYCSHIFISILLQKWKARGLMVLWVRRMELSSYS